MDNNDTFVIEREYGVISEKGNKTLELNSVSWFGRNAMYDLRYWKRMSGIKVPVRGITLSDSELDGLHDLLKNMYAEV